MTRNRFLERCAVAAGGLVVIAVSVASASFAANPNTDPGRQEAITPDHAVSRVARSLGLDADGLMVDRLIETAQSSAFHVVGPRLEGAVDVATGSIGLLTLFDRVPSSREVKVREAAAIDAATTFADELGVVRPAVGQPQVLLLDHGSMMEYQVAWLMRVNGVRVPRQLIVSVNPSTGEAYSLVNVDRPYSDPASPAVDNQAAVQAGLAVLGNDATSQDAELNIVFLQDGTQRTVWELKFVVGDPDAYQMGEAVRVDAEDASILDIGNP